MLLDSVLDTYSSTLTSLLDKLLPARLVRKRIAPHTPWFDHEYAAAKHTAPVLERRYIRSGHDPAHRSTWVRQIRSLHKLYRSKKPSYWSTSITKHQGDSQKCWGVMNKLLGRDRAIHSVDGGNGKSKNLTATDFANFFSGKVSDIRSFTATASLSSCLNLVHQVANFMISGR